MIKSFFFVASAALVVLLFISVYYYSSSTREHDVIENYGMAGTITARISSVSLQLIESQECEADSTKIKTHGVLIAELDRQVTIYYGSKSYTTNKLILTGEPHPYIDSQKGIRISFDDIAHNFRNEISHPWDYYVAREVCLGGSRQPIIGMLRLSN